MASILLPDSDTFLRLRQARRNVAENPERRHATLGEIGNIALIGTSLLGKGADLAARGFGELQRRSQEQKAIDNRQREIDQYNANADAERQNLGADMARRRIEMMYKGRSTPLEYHGDVPGQQYAGGADNTVNRISQDNPPINPALMAAHRITPEEIDAMPRTDNPRANPLLQSIDAAQLPVQPKPVAQRTAPTDAELQQMEPHTPIPQQTPQSVMLPHLGLAQSGTDNLNQGAPRQLRTLAQLRMAALAAQNDPAERKRIAEDLQALGPGAYAPQNLEEAISGQGQDRTATEFGHLLNPPRTKTPEELLLMMARLGYLGERTKGQKTKNKIAEETGLPTAKANQRAAEAHADVAEGTAQPQIETAGAKADLAKLKAQNEPALFESQQRLRKRQADELAARQLEELWRTSGPGGRARMQKDLAQAFQSRASGRRSLKQTELLPTDQLLKVISTMSGVERVELQKKLLEQRATSGKIAPDAMRALTHLQALHEKIPQEERLPETAEELQKSYPEMSLSDLDKMARENIVKNQKNKALVTKGQSDLQAARDAAQSVLSRYPELVDDFAPYMGIGEMATGK